MPGDGELFDFSDRQFKLLIILGTLTLVLALTYMAQIWLFAPSSSAPLPIHVGEQPTELHAIFTCDPNFSPADSLELLPGIGPVLAKRIVEYRQTHRFDSLADLKNVDGVGEKLLETIAPYLRIQQ